VREPMSVIASELEENSARVATNIATDENFIRTPTAIASETILFILERSSIVISDNWI
jgi:hypothetical protein